MYRVNVNARFFQTNLKRKSETQIPSKTKFSLTDLQKQFIETCLPKGYKLSLVNEMDEKRNRTPKKADASFETQFFRRDDKREHFSTEKKTDKRQDKKDAQKLESMVSIDKSANSKKSQMQSQRQTKQKQKRNKNDNKEIKIEDDPENGQKMLPQTVLQQKKISAKHNKKIDPTQSKQYQQLLQKFKKLQQLFEAKKQQQHESILRQEALKKTNYQKSDTVEAKNQIINQQPASNSQKQNQTLCEQKKQFYMKIINKLKIHKSSWPFRFPVDPIAQQVPNYLQIVKQPMDLETIRKKLKNNQYRHSSQINLDVNQIFLNSYKFNPKQTVYHKLTDELYDYYHKLIHQIQNNPSVLQNDNNGKNSKTKITQKVQQDFIEQTTMRKKKPVNINNSKSIAQNVLNPANQQIDKPIIQQTPKKQKSSAIKIKPKFSDLDKRELIKKIQKLSSKSLENIVLIVFGDIQDEEQTTFHLDFDKLSDDALIKIDAIVKADLDKYQFKTKTIGLQTRMSLF